MSWKRWVALSGLLLAFTTFGSSAVAGETPETESKPADEEKKPTPEAKAPPETSKPRWWGDRFALYIESNTGGAATARDIDTSIDFGDRLNSKVISSSGVEFNKMDYGRLAIGWQLPAQRGMFLVAWNGVRETDYRFNASGAEKFARIREGGILTTNYTRDVEGALTWWRVRVLGGRLTAQRSIPICERQAGACSSITYEYDNLDLNTTVEASIAPDLQNRAQTLDFLYQREFGGRRFSGRWTCGPRYFLYRGTVPAAAWLNDADFPGIGYTDGKYIHLLSVSQDTKGYGVTGSLEAQYHFLRNRVVLYAQGRAAYIYQNLSADTGDFFTLVRDNTLPDTMYPTPARLQQNRTKTSWQVGVEAGARIRLVEGLQFEAGAGQTSYQDSVLVPTTILIPKTYADSAQGTSALYKTHDILYNGWHAGFSYQF